LAEVVIVGAGLTGLTAAYYLEKNNFHDFKIFEKENLSGGLLRSFNQDGFTFDFTGHLLHINNQDFYNFLNEVAGINNFFVQNRNSSIFMQNTFTQYPFQTNLYGLPENIIYDVIYGFINRKKNIKSPKSFHEWVLKYFGAGIGKHFLFPYNKKLLSYDIKKIDHTWTGRFVPQTDLKSIIYSALNNKNTKNNLGYNSSFYYPKYGGINYLINKLQDKIKNKINNNFNLIKIDLKNKILIFENGYTEKFKYLISSVPLNYLLEISQDKANTSLQVNHKNLLCNSVINFNLGFNVQNFKNNNLNNKHWIYFSEKQYNFYRLGFWHNINHNLTPNNYCAIYGEVSYINKNYKYRNNLTNSSIKQALEFLNIKQDDIIVNNILNINNAYVIYNNWRQKNLHKLQEKLLLENIHSIGRFGAWKYSSMQEAFLDGKQAATKILDDLNINKNFRGLITHEHKNIAKLLQQ